MTVSVPPGSYHYWVAWKTQGKEVESARNRSDTSPLRVTFSALPQDAAAVRVVVVDLASKRAALVAPDNKPEVSLAPQDFRYLESVTLRVTAPLKDRELKGAATLIDAEQTHTRPLVLRQGEGACAFDLVLLGPTTLRIEVPGLEPYEGKVELEGANGQPVTQIVRALKAAGGDTETVVGEPFGRSRAATIIAGLAAICLGVSLIAFFALAIVALARPQAASLTLRPGADLALWLVPLLCLGVVATGWAAIAWAHGEREAVLLPTAFFGLLGLVLSQTLTRLGKTWASAAVLSLAAGFSAATGLACAQQGDAFLGGAGLLGSAWCLLGAGYLVALAAQTAAARQAPVAGAQVAAPLAAAVRGEAAVAAGICPFCGTAKDPLTGACACTVTPPAAPPHVAPAQLTAVSGPALIGEAGEAAGKVFAISGTLTLGRDPQSGIVLADKTVSRRHCTLSLDAGVLSVRDEGSANGTFVNGQRISVARLEPNDVLQIGGCRFRYVAEVSEQA